MEKSEWPDSIKHVRIAIYHRPNGEVCHKSYTNHLPPNVPNQFLTSLKKCHPKEKTVLVTLCILT